MPKVLEVNLMFVLPDDYTEEKYPDIAAKIDFMMDGGGICDGSVTNVCNIEHGASSCMYPNEKAYNERP